MRHDVEAKCQFHQHFTQAFCARQYFCAKQLQSQNVTREKHE